MVDKSEPQGCRNAAIATSFLLGFAVVLMVSGLSLVTRDSCEGLCETVGLTLLYAGGPQDRRGRREMSGYVRA